MLREHEGNVPRDAAALRALPGIGRYTSGAIRSIAFDEPAAIVDANVRRVIARLVAAATLSDADIWTKAEELVPDEMPGRFNQALMELGATLCTPRMLYEKWRQTGSPHTAKILRQAGVVLPPHSRRQEPC